MARERERLEAGISAIEAQRVRLGDSVVEIAVAGLRAKLAVLDAFPESVPVQALEQVSIRFLDAVGFTTLAQPLGPDAISAVMDDALSRGAAIIEAHGGLTAPLAVATVD